MVINHALTEGVASHAGWPSLAAQKDAKSLAAAITKWLRNIQAY